MKAQFHPNDVLAVCKRYVYPPCKKMADSISLKDRLASDLGYVGTAASLLALKTNETFQLDAACRFSAMNFATIETVRDHVEEICRKLAGAGRLALPQAA